MKYVVVVFLTIALTACVEENSSMGSDSVGTSLANNTVWPYEVVGEIDIVDAGFGDSDVPSWAVGSIIIKDEELLIEFGSNVLRKAQIDADFAFSSPATLMLGKPRSEGGALIYPVVDIK